MYMQRMSTTLCVLIVASCTLLPEKKETSQPVNGDSAAITDTLFYADTSNPLCIHTNNTSPQEVINYAQTFIGVPYLYASSDPLKGFDCSGFITYVFNHFNIDVPRSSVNFTDVPHEVAVDEAKPADLILFTGTDSTIRTVGHMGIVIQNNEYNGLTFIHSSSGRANSVTVTPLNDYYRGRFVKVIRIFPQNDMN